MFFSYDFKQLTKTKLMKKKDAKIFTSLFFESNVFTTILSLHLSLAVSSILVCTIGWDTEVNKHTIVKDNLDGETTNGKKNYDEHAKDRAEL